MIDVTRAAENLGRPLPPRPLVSVVVPLFNSQATLEACVRSLLGQTYRNVEIILSDDGSSDGSIALASRLSAEDHRIRVVRFGGNHGIYWARNFGVLNCRGDVITFSAPDDTSDANRIEHQLDALRRPGAVVSTCSCRCVDEYGNPVAMGATSDLSPKTQMVRRELFEIVGFFDCVRAGADDEMLQRIRLVFGSQSHENVPSQLYTAVVGSVSFPDGREHPARSTEGRGMSALRQGYVARALDWHAAVAAHGDIPYMPFPVVRRPFPVDEKLEIAMGRGTDETLTVVAYGSAARTAEGCQLERVVTRMVACRQRLTPDAEAADGRSNVVRLDSKPSPEECLNLARGTGAGYFVLRDLDAKLPPDFLQRAILSVESTPGRSGVESLTSEAGDPGKPVHAFHINGNGAADCVKDFTSDWSAASVASTAGAEASARDTPRRSRSRLSAELGRAGGDEGVAGRWSSATRIRQATGAGVVVVRRFLALWARSEVLLASWVLAFAMIAMAALAADMHRLLGVAAAAGVAGIFAAVLMTARRTRLMADPIAGVEGRKRVVDFVAALRSFRAAVLARRVYTPLE